VEVKLLARAGELHVLARSRDRVAKERSKRRRRGRRLLGRRPQLQNLKQLKRDALLLKLGPAKAEAGRALGRVKLTLPEAGDEVSPERFHCRIDHPKLRGVDRRAGRHLLRSNLCEAAPGKLWERCLPLVPSAAAFSNLKGDLSLRPVFQQRAARLDAPVFISFPSGCRHVTGRRRRRDLAPGRTARAGLGKFGALQMSAVHLPPDAGRPVMRARYPPPEKELPMLIEALPLELPAPPPPRLTATGQLAE